MKPEPQRAYRIAADLLRFLRENDQSVVLDDRFAAWLGEKGVPLEKLEADLFACVGGDGTILRTLGVTDKPVFAVNSGSIGFLAEVEPKYASAGAKRILDGQYSVEERMKFSVWLNDEKLPDVANEVTIQSAKIAKMIQYQLYVDDELADTIRGDGVIVATSMGSTAYAMSAGGPIMDPSIEAGLVVPVAPFRIAVRPFIVPATKTIRIRLLQPENEARGKDAKLVLDGQHAYGVPLEGEITVRKSPLKVRFVRFGGGFYERVRTKLMR